MTELMGSRLDDRACPSQALARGPRAAELLEAGWAPAGVAAADTGCLGFRPLRDVLQPGPLWSACGPQPTDLRAGLFGDCALASVLAHAARHHPRALAGRLAPTPRGAWVDYFCQDGPRSWRPARCWVSFAVPRLLPPLHRICTDMGHAGARWPALVQRACALTVGASADYRQLEGLSPRRAVGWWWGVAACFEPQLSVEPRLSLGELCVIHLRAHAWEVVGRDDDGRWRLSSPSTLSARPRSLCRSWPWLLARQAQLTWAPALAGASALHVGED